MKRITTIILLIASTAYAGLSINGGAISTRGASLAVGPLATAAPPPSSACTPASGFLHCRLITIDATQVGGSTLSNFPVLVSATLGSSRIQNASCFDIVFTSDSGGTTKIPWEQETCTQGTGAIKDWVKVVSVSSSVNTIVYVSYDNSGISTAQNTGVAASTNVWTNGFQGVWHLPDGSTLSFLDSTVGAHNGTMQGTVTAAVGQIDGAEAQDGNIANYITVGSTVQPAATAVTVSAWVKATAGTVGVILNKNYDGSTVPYLLGSPGAGTPGFAFFDGASFHTTGVGTDYRGDGNFHYVVGTYEGTTENYYLDGVIDGTLSFSGSMSTTNTGQTSIGNYINNSETLAGTIDEARVSNVVRTQGWLTAEFNNQKTSPTFPTVGSEL